MIATQLALAGVMCLLLFVHDRGDMWLLYVVTLLYGLGGDLFAASRGAMLKAMLARRAARRGERRATSRSAKGFRIVAPLAGAGIFAAFGGAVVAIVDAATFLVSAAALVALRVRRAARAP